MKKGGRNILKKVYETPSVEVVKFEYKDQVVAQSGCLNRYKNTSAVGVNACDDPVVVEKLN